MLCRIIAFAALLQVSVALVEFEKSKLYDETDFEQEIVIANNFCDVGCRIYASVPEDSAEIAKQIFVLEHDPNANSLYDISKLIHNDEKGFVKVQPGNLSISIINLNEGKATAPVAVWIVRNDVKLYEEEVKVFDASAIPTEPSSYGRVTVMSVEPFSLRLQTDRPMGSMRATHTGYDAVDLESGNRCQPVIEELFPSSFFPSHMQFNLQSPLISFQFFRKEPKIALTAIFEKDKALDFSGISFVASPGYIGCKGNKTFRSSLYKTYTAFRYSKDDRAYDVVLFSPILTTDAAHPVSIKDITNQIAKELSAPEKYQFHGIVLNNTRSIEISWIRNDDDLDQSFVIRIFPSNAKNLGPDTTEQKPTAASASSNQHSER